MPRSGTARRKRERAGLPDVKPGRVGWIFGSKLVFMSQYKDAYIEAAQLGQVQAGRLYDDVTDAYLKKYGYNTPYDGDLEDGQDIADDVDEDEDVDQLSPEEGEARWTYFKEVRGVGGAPLPGDNSR